MFKKKQSLYFIEKPIERKEKDLIGISKQVEFLKQSIKNGARFIGVISGFSSGKSSITNKIKLAGYKVIKINMWKEISGNEEKTEDLHKDFLYQLAMQTKKIKTQYLLDRYSNNGKKIKIVSKTEKLSEFLIFAVFFGLLSWLINTNTGMTFMIKLIRAFGFDLMSSVKIYTFILSFFVLVFLIYVALAIYCLLKTGFVLSFWGTETKSFSKNEMMEIYNSIVDKNKKYIIIIEDIDRTNNKIVRTKFIREIYEMYYKSNNKSVFIIEIGKEQLNEDKSNDIEKQFDVMLECGEIDFSNADVKLLDSLLQTRRQELLDIGLDIDDKKIKWNLLCTGENINLRKLKHKYNKAILRYETLRSRFPNSKININTCLVIDYLMDKYKMSNDELLKTLIKKYLGAPLDRTAVPTNDGIEKEIYSFVKDGTLTEEYNRYTNNYPQASKYRTEDEAFVYQLIVNNDIENTQKGKMVIDRLKTLNEQVIEAMEIRINTYKEIPEVMLENERLFNLVISNGDWKKRFITKFDEAKEDKKIIYISKLVEYNLNESFWKELLKGKGLNTYKFRSLLYENEPCIINIEKLKELYENVDEPITVDEMLRINNVENVLSLINVIKDREIIIKKLNSIYENISITDEKNFRIEVFAEDLHIFDNAKNTDDAVMLLINIIEHNSILLNEQLSRLIRSLEKLSETMVERIVQMLNSKFNICDGLVKELIIRIAKRDKKYSLNDVHTQMLLANNYHYEYLICKALKEGVLNDKPEIDKDVFVRVFKDYYDGENLTLSRNVLIMIYDDELIKTEPWNKIKAFVGVMNKFALYMRMVDLIAEGNSEVIESFEEYKGLNGDEEDALVTHICKSIQVQEYSNAISDKLYNKVRPKSKRKLTIKTKSNN